MPSVVSSFSDLCQGPLHSNASGWNVCQTLAEAHARTSTREHDRVYALASIYPDIINAITIDYKQSLHDLMIQFYGLLAKSDLSILCFEGMYGDNDMQKYNLPSWTGATEQHRTGYTLDPSTRVQVDIDGRFMHVTCAGIPSNRKPAVEDDPSHWTFDDIPPRPEGPHRRLKKENLFWQHQNSDNASSWFDFDLTNNENMNDATTANIKEGEHVMLSGIPFTLNPEYFFADYTAPAPETFTIQ
ncbi:hypothetical protein BDB00DRAFT_927579 [Zychaea mexicana]|uniref:uncharacterized protein n=1 Tax=Zychaea mexicana TaxID=64656 RepID=UPI0022FE6929|nr:uncharacterized protein BDB00DRAFT_927579 [Zychaea mexicana]KAI9495411.1 hypothetical protein BDB00DRAFT_927579 [Zychaea mexicana]